MDVLESPPLESPPRLCENSGRQIQNVLSRVGVVLTANLHDASVADRHGFDNATLIVHGNDAFVTQDQLGGAAIHIRIWRLEVTVSLLLSDIRVID